MIAVAKRLRLHQCGVPPRDGYPVADPGTIAPLVLATLLFAIRMAAKFMGLGGGWGPDDYTIIVSWVRTVYYGEYWNLLTCATCCRSWLSLYSRSMLGVSCAKVDMRSNLTVPAVHYGFSRHMWDIDPLDNITKAYKVRIILYLRSYAKVLISRYSTATLCYTRWRSPSRKYPSVYFYCESSEHLHSAFSHTL